MKCDLRCRADLWVCQCYTSSSLESLQNLESRHQSWEQPKILPWKPNVHRMRRMSRLYAWWLPIASPIIQSMKIARRFHSFRFATVSESTNLNQSRTTWKYRSRYKTYHFSAPRSLIWSKDKRKCEAPLWVRMFRVHPSWTNWHNLHEGNSWTVNLQLTKDHSAPICTGACPGQYICDRASFPAS